MWQVLTPKKFLLSYSLSLCFQARYVDSETKSKAIKEDINLIVSVKLVMSIIIGAKPKIIPSIALLKYVVEF